MKKLFPLIVSIGLVVSLFSQMPHSLAKTNDVTVTIQADTVNIRSAPNTEATILQQASRGDMFAYVAEQGEWLEIELSTGNTGWVANWLAAKIEATGEIPTSKIAVVITDLLNVRATPALDATVTGRLQIHSEVTIVSEQNEWLEIIFKDATGWINKEYVTVVAQKYEEVVDATDELLTESDGLFATVTASTLHVHRKSTLDSKVVGTITGGERVEIVEEEKNWTKIKYSKRKSGWVANWFLQKNEVIFPAQADEKVKKSSILILHDETNIRAAADGFAPLVKRAQSGQVFPVVRKVGDWYEIDVADAEDAYVAGWLVKAQGEVAQVEKPGVEKYLKDKTIVIDPGHGGNDRGATGVLGSIEKQLTLQTAQKIASKLRDSGAHVILTRTTDAYVSLPARVSKSNYLPTDAFISVHFDSLEDASVRGMTSYYYYNFQKPFAEFVHKEVVGKTKLASRDTRYGDYYVLRENFQHAVLLELGYLSNPVEESYITTTQFQSSVATGIHDGLARYFRD